MTSHYHDVVVPIKIYTLVYFREEMPKNGATISDLIMNSSVTLTPMFNLGKARRESSQRKEK